MLQIVSSFTLNFPSPAVCVTRRSPKKTTNKKADIPAVFVIVKCKPSYCVVCKPHIVASIHCVVYRESINSLTFDVFPLT